MDRQKIDLEQTLKHINSKTKAKPASSEIEQ